MPPKIRELIENLENAGFVSRGGKGSHRNFKHPKVSGTVLLSGGLGDDAQPYQIKRILKAIKEAKR
jgi:predicted RNA binding protein YcfA (HicA-like mRNA interferase family)